jgi:hypothetical protein
MLISLPTNPFFRKHVDYFAPIMNGIIIDYEVANRLEKGSDPDRELSWFMRDTAGALLAHCAFIIDGEIWAKEVHYHVVRMHHDETVEEYKRELGV